jgi:PAS domain S-box-containing protein
MFLSITEERIKPIVMTLQALIAPVVVILFICVGVILIVVMSGAQVQDEAEVRRSQQIAVSALKIVGRNLGRLAISRVRTDEAYTKLARSFDGKWAEEILGGRLHNGFGEAQAFLFSPENELLYRSGDFPAKPTGSLGVLLSGVRSTPTSPPESTGGFATIGEVTYVVVASIVAPEETGGQQKFGTVLVLAQPIDGPLLKRLEEEFLLEGLRFKRTQSPDDRYGIIIHGLDGENLGTLVWAPQQPGQALFDDILVPIAIATMLAGLLLSYFLRTAVRAALEIRRNARALKESGLALEYSEDKLRAIIDGVGDGIVVFDEAGTITSANQSVERIFGYDLDELVGQNAAVLLAGSVADTGEEAKPDLALKADKKITGTRYRELTGRRRDGSRFILDTAISSVKYQSGTIAIAIMRDITERKQAEETLNLLSTGMVLVNRECRLLMANRSAMRILDSGHGLQLVDGLVSATGNSPAEQLCNFVDGACGGNATSVMIIERGDTVRPLSVMVAPLHLTQPGEGSPVAAIFIRDLEARLTVAPEVLGKLFGLTPAEARVVVELVKGKRPQEVATDLNVTVNTVRNQLKQIFSKTNTGRQSELVSLVLSSTAFLSEHGAPEQAAAGGAFLTGS